ncbi:MULTISPECIES: hypothetical protein [Xanthomonas]|uniref:hypothetical protein n=1 Tax=Xanthomonas TaxID=338 RepID=UPI00052D8A74|nr:hypothetical protein XACG102_10730001 [Xanthomonas citri pv. citri]CEI03285.1 hypothetical protein XACG117_3260005 [Xanthomonas citri pv. citri]
METKYLAHEWTEVQIVVRTDGKPIDGTAHAYLLESGAHFDSDLQAFVLEAGGMPWSYLAFLPANELTVRRVSVPYDPAWYGSKSPYPTFDELPMVFSGYPLDGDPTFVCYWFLRRGDHEPFMSTWSDGSWSSAQGRISPSDAVAEGWHMIATMREIIEMTYVIIDEAHERRANKAELELIAAYEGRASALRVALEAGRLRN